MLTLQAKLELKTEDKKTLLELMRKFSSCVRYAYQRLLEGWKRKDLKKHLQEVFKLNSRYCDDAILKARSILSSIKEKEQNPRKVVFGGRRLFKKLSKNHLSGRRRIELKRKWKEKRQGTLYSRGDKSKDGNLNLRFVFVSNGLYLRINTGEKSWIYAKVIRKATREKDKWIDFIWRLQNDSFPYSVELKLRDGEIYVLVSYEEVFPEISITKDNGVIGIDLNASPQHVVWAEVSRDGNLASYGSISLHNLIGKTKNQRDYILWYKAYEVVFIAKEKGKAIALERLVKVKKGYRGDGKAKLRKRLSQWVYRSLIEKIKVLAKRNGIEVIEVDPAFSSVIGMLKYCPSCLIDKDVAGAYVIGRRALGFREDIPENYLRLLSDREYLEYSLCKLIEKKEELKQRLKAEANPYKRNAIKTDIKKVVRDINLLQSLYREPEAREPVKPEEGTGKGRTILGSQKLWQVVRASLGIPLLGKSFVRDFSPLRFLIISGDWKGLLKRRVPVLGAGAMAVQIPPAGAGLPEKAEYKYPSPECSFVHSG